MRPRKRYLSSMEREAGFETMPITARYRGGSCGVCRRAIPAGETIVKFRGRGWCHIACTTRVTVLEDFIRVTKQNLADPEYRTRQDPIWVQKNIEQLPKDEAALAEMLNQKGPNDA